jgi:hypothetical protein
MDTAKIQHLSKYINELLDFDGLSEGTGTIGSMESRKVPQCGADGWDPVASLMIEKANKAIKKVVVAEIELAKAELNGLLQEI